MNPESLSDLDAFTKVAAEIFSEYSEEDKFAVRHFQKDYFFYSKITHRAREILDRQRMKYQEYLPNDIADQVIKMAKAEIHLRENQ